MNLVQHVFMWVGIYLTVGLLFSFFNIADTKDWITDPHRSEKEFNELCTFSFVFMMFWPLLIPMLLYLEVCERYLRRHDKKVDRMWEGKHNLLGFLGELDIIEEENLVKYARDLHNDRVKLRESKRKKFKL